MPDEPNDRSSDVLDAARAWVAEAEWCDTFEDRMTEVFENFGDNPKLKALMETDDGKRWDGWRRRRDEDVRELVPILIAEVERLRSLVTRATGQTFGVRGGADELGPPF